MHMTCLVIDDEPSAQIVLKKYIEDVDFHDVNSRTERSKIKFDIYYKLTSVFTYVTLRAQKNNSLHCL